jgi:hypothetical protein
MLVLFCFTGCGSKAAVSEVYDDFRAKVNKGDMDGAWAMLDDSSKQGFENLDEFKRVVESIKDTAFAESSVIRGTSYVGGNENMSQGQINLMDDNGKKIGDAGSFTAVRESGKWWVNWTLPRKVTSSGEIPGGSTGQ